MTLCTFCQTFLIPGLKIHNIQVIISNIKFGLIQYFVFISTIAENWVIGDSEFKLMGLIIIGIVPFNRIILEG